ncbi:MULTISPECIES: sensor histidine kinase [unclassified Streptomyces]|uniref:sensor histidine kinase n=1 Tax=unclassified Streptomyces TaxID=2593676 RepID=UPI002E81B931|nr:sensor histidine kinase [Streptomyces sp. NBC_00589]WTI37604.1 sensor histidine kinase [Streptomyces sp. NBC_00775]WUB28718.1 sensor histidine kinase [Streptomyces sp. NBC_00589]
MISEEHRDPDSEPSMPRMPPPGPPVSHDAGLSPRDATRRPQRQDGTGESSLRKARKAARKPNPQEASDNAAAPHTRPAARARGVRALVGSVLTDLGSSSAAPLPPLSRPRWLRWLPHVVVCWIALGVALAGVDTLNSSYRLGFAMGTSTGLAQGAAIALALWRPVPAWWLSLGATVLAASAARGHMPVDFLPPGPDWPWSSPAITAQAFVLFLLALRVPARVAVGALSLTALATYVVQGLVGGQVYRSTGLMAIVVFAAVVLLGTALRGRREARTQLVEQASLTEEERARRTLLEERSRIARELHDVVAHHMSVISIQAQVAPHLVENPTEELKENLEGIRQNALEALTELRRVLGVLRSENPEDPYGLGAGTGAAPDAPQPTLDRLDALVENTRAAGLDVTTEITGDQLPLAPGVELSAYRIIQEALSNALRHAPGSAVRVELWHFPRGLQVRVVNSRPERPAPPSPGAGHGLLGMRERVAMLGGTLVTSETSCGGFAVAAFLPRNGAAPAGEGPEDDMPPPGSTDDNSTGLPGEETP